MKVWIFNNYNMLPEHGGLNRGFYLGKYLAKNGNKPVVFVGSHPHNTDLQLIEGKEKYSVYQKEPFPWVLVKTCNYKGSKLKRIFSMLQYYRNAKKAAKQFAHPDVIIGSSAHPLAALLAIRLGKKYRCKKLVEVRDLWPESIVSYGVLKSSHPLVKLLYRFEKYLYTHADGVIFTMKGAYDYIIERGWDKEIPKSKVFYLNNGVDLELFNYNKEHFCFKDSDLDDPDTYKIVYTGALRHANDSLGALFDAIELMQGEKYRDVRFLIYGNGELLPRLEQRCAEHNLKNVRMKGFLEKKYLPYVLSKCDLNILNCTANSILSRYGGSQNKLFDYLASGKPIISGEDGKYSVIKEYGCGISQTFATAEDFVSAIDRIKSRPIDRELILSTAEKFDFWKLARELESIISV